MTQSLPPSAVITVSDDAWDMNTDIAHHSGSKGSQVSYLGSRCKARPAKYQVRHAQMSYWQAQLKSWKGLFAEEKKGKLNVSLRLKKGLRRTIV